MADDTGAVIIYTDGGCDPNPGVGGWGAVLLHGDRRKELSGGAAESTNNRMELTAAIEALAPGRPVLLSLQPSQAPHRTVQRPTVFDMVSLMMTSVTTKMLPRFGGSGIVPTNGCWVLLTVRPSSVAQR